MWRVRNCACATIACAWLVGCSDQRGAQLATAESRIAALQHQVEALDTRLRSLENKTKDPSTAVLMPGSNDYSVIESDLARFAVRLADVQPYPNGSRIVLTFGNLTSATINTPRLKVQWGHDQSKDIEISQSFRPGTWTDVPVVLEGIAPNALDSIRVRDLTHTSVTLRR